MSKREDEGYSFKQEDTQDADEWGVHCEVEVSKSGEIPKVCTSCHDGIFNTFFTQLCMVV